VTSAADFLVIMFALVAPSAAVSHDAVLPGDGQNLHIETLGESAPTIVFEAGLGNDSSTCKPITGPIAKFARVVLYDRAGLGQSLDYREQGSPDYGRQSGNKAGHREDVRQDIGRMKRRESGVLDQLMTKEGSPAVGGYDDKLRAAFGLPQKQFGFDAMPGGRSNTLSIPHAKGSKGLLPWVTANGHPYFIWGSLKALTKVCYISLSMATLTFTTTTKYAAAQGTPLFDQELITIAGRTLRVENANQPWSLNQLGPNRFRFELRSGDIWPNRGGFTELTEIAAGGYFYPPGTTTTVSYNFMLEPGPVNIAPWLVIGQWHSVYNVTNQPAHPPFAIYLFNNDV